VTTELRYALADQGQLGTTGLANRSGAGESFGKAASASSGANRPAKLQRPGRVRAFRKIESGVSANTSTIPKHQNAPGHAVHEPSEAAGERAGRLRQGDEAEIGLARVGRPDGDRGRSGGRASSFLGPLLEGHCTHAQAARLLGASWAITSRPSASDEFEQSDHRIDPARRHCLDAGRPSCRRRRQWPPNAIRLELRAAPRAEATARAVEEQIILIKNISSGHSHCLGQEIHTCSDSRQAASCYLSKQYNLTQEASLSKQALVRQASSHSVVCGQCLFRLGCAPANYLATRCPALLTC